MLHFDLIIFHLFNCQMIAEMSEISRFTFVYIWTKGKVVCNCVEVGQTDARLSCTWGQDSHWGAGLRCQSGHHLADCPDLFRPRQQSQHHSESHHLHPASELMQQRRLMKRLHAGGSLAGGPAADWILGAVLQADSWTFRCRLTWSYSNRLVKGRVKAVGMKASHLNYI